MKKLEQNQKHKIYGGFAVGTVAGAVSTLWSKIMLFSTIANLSTSLIGGLVNLGLASSQKQEEHQVVKNIVPYNPQIHQVLYRIN